MAEEPTKQAATSAFAALVGTGALSSLGVWLFGIFNGANKQNADLRKSLQEEIERLNTEAVRLRKRASFTLDWQDLCLKARREAEKLGYDPSKWPIDPEEDDA